MADFMRIKLPHWRISWLAPTRCPFLLNEALTVTLITTLTTTAHINQSSLGRANGAMR